MQITGEIFWLTYEINVFRNNIVEFTELVIDDDIVLSCLTVLHCTCCRTVVIFSAYAKYVYVYSG